MTGQFSIRTIGFITLYFLLSLPVLSFGQPLNQQQIDNLTAFSNLYGDVRWFYPGDEAQQIPWDALAKYGAQTVAEAKSPATLRETLSKLFQPIAPAVTLYPQSAQIRFNPEALKPEDGQSVKPISWIRFGLPRESQDPTFIGRRTYREVSGAGAEPAFGNMSQFVETSKIAGKPVRISAAMAMEPGSSGSGQLWIREVRESGVDGWMDNMDDSPVVSTEWARYQIDGKAASDVVGLAFGGFLIGTGGMLVDDFKIEYEDSGRWIDVPIKNAGFEGERYLSEWKIQAREHKTTIETKRPFAGKQSLRLATTQQALPEEENTNGAPEPGEHILQTIGNDIQALVPLTVWGTARQTFPIANPDLLATLQANLKSTKYTANIERVAVWIETWNLIRFFHPHPPKDWNLAFAKGLPDVWADQDIPTFCRTVEKLLAPVQDGQLHFFHPSDRTLNAFPAVAIDSVEGKLVVTGVFSNDAELKPGDEVLEIDGQKADEYLKSLYPGISGGTPGFRRKQVMLRAMRGPAKSMMVLKVKTAEGKKDVSFQRKLAISQWSEGQKLNYVKPFHEIQRGLVYADLTRLGAQELPEVVELMADADQIILDLRGFARNNHPFIGHLLTQRDTAKSWMRIQQPHCPGRPENLPEIRQGWMIDPAQPHLNAKIVALISEESIGYTESIIALLQEYNLATLIGTTTGGTNGQHINQALSGGYLISFTGMEVTLPSGKPLYAVGISPKMEVKQSLKSTAAGIDDVLESAIHYLRP